MKIRFLQTREVKDENKKVVQTFKEGKTYDLEDQSARHWLNRGAAEPVEDEATKEAQEIRPVDEVKMTPADVRKLHRAELDELAKEKGIDLGDFNVPDSREHLISELGLTDEAE